jgi:hypothetical protein
LTDFIGFGVTIGKGQRIDANGGKSVRVRRCSGPLFRSHQEQELPRTGEMGHTRLSIADQ